MMRSLEEQLGVWGEAKHKEPEEKEAESDTQDECIYEEARQQNSPTENSKKCNFLTNDSIKMVCSMTRHAGYYCNNND